MAQAACTATKVEEEGFSVKFGTECYCGISEGQTKLTCVDMACLTCNGKKVFVQSFPLEISIRKAEWWSLSSQKLSISKEDWI